MIVADWSKLEQLALNRLDYNTQQFQEAFDKQDYRKCISIRNARMGILDSYRNVALNYKNWEPLYRDLFDILGYKPTIVGGHDDVRKNN